MVGMNVAAGPRLAAAVTNAGGIGVIGGLHLSPKMLQDSIDQIKSHLEDKEAPFGVDLLIPQLGGNARKTNVSHLQPHIIFCVLDQNLAFSLIIRTATSQR